MTGSTGPASERGAAALLVVMMSSVLVLVGMAGSFVAAVTSAHRAVQAAADLSALAAAGALQDGADPCAEAAAIALSNGAQLSSCQIQGEEVWIEVTAPTPSWGRYAGTATGRAHAGPGER